RLGWLCELRQLSARAPSLRAVLLPGHHLGEGTSRVDPEGLHGQPRVGVLRLAGGGRSPVLRTGQCRRRLGREEGTPPAHGPPDGKASGIGHARDAVFVAGRRERPGSIRRQRQQFDRGRTNRPPRLRDGAGPALLRRDRGPVGAVHGQAGRTGARGLTMAAPWERLPGESPRAYAAFCLYRDLGPRRSLDAASRGYHHPPPPGGDGKPTARRPRASGRIRQWAQRWNWGARARAWDQELGRVQWAEQIAAVKEMAERHAKEALLLQNKAVERLRQLRPE